MHNSECYHTFYNIIMAMISKEDTSFPSVILGPPRLFKKMYFYRNSVEHHQRCKTNITILILQAQGMPSNTNLPKPDQWLGSVTTQATSAAPPVFSTSPRRAPPLHARALSLGSAAMPPTSNRTGAADPFDAEWAEIAARNLRQASTTNPFIVPNTTQAFQVSCEVFL